MKITGIEIEHTNPSMGPYEKVKTIYLSNISPHEEKFNNFLLEAKIFNYTFEEYLNAVVKKDKKILDQISKGIQSTDRSRLNDGATISNLKISLKDQSSVTLSDLRYYEFSGYYHEFISYLATQGHSHIRSSGKEIEGLLKPAIKNDDEIIIDRSRIIKKKKNN